MRRLAGGTDSRPARDRQSDSLAPAIRRTLHTQAVVVPRFVGSRVVARVVRSPRGDVRRDGVRFSSLIAVVSLVLQTIVKSCAWFWYSRPIARNLMRETGGSGEEGAAGP